MSDRRIHHISPGPLCRALPLATMALCFACDAPDRDLPVEGVLQIDPVDAHNLFIEQLEEELAEEELDGEVEEMQCSEEVVPPVVELSWTEASYAKDTPTTLKGSVATFTIKNPTESAYVVNLSAAADDGGVDKAAIELGKLELAGGETRVVPIDLEAFELDIAGMRYSGRVVVAAELTNDGKPFAQDTSIPLYFHPGADDELKVYSATVLRDTFNAGNFKAIELPQQFEMLDLINEQERSVIDRVTWGGGEDKGDLAEPGADEIAHGAEASSNRLAAESLEPRANYTACFFFDILTTDSGFTNFAGQKETWWNTQNSVNAGDVIARGVRVKIGSTTYDTDTTTGCVTFSSSGTDDVRIYAYAKDANDNYVRIHDGAQDDTSSYPGSTFSHLISSKVFSGGTNNISIGGDTARWTSMAALAESMYRYHNGLSNAEFHVAESTSGDTPLCDNRAYGVDTTNKEAYIRISDDSCGTYAGQKRKFLAGHERGHAHARLYAVTGHTFTTTHSVSPTSCFMDPPNAPMGLQATGYSMESKEWSSVGSEGFADFFGARIFNNYAVEAGGVYHRMGTTYDLEKWNSSNTQRGYLRNICCSGSNCANSLDGAGTRQDWMRAFWDLYTYAGCSPSTDRLTMLQLWNSLVEQSGIANDVWFPKSQSAMDDLIDAGTLGSCYATKWDYYGCWNGIDYQGGLPSGSC